ncbi:MAG: hypothetical protein HOY69_04755, partial [Streptomyces sp.]|nr:hypothetical protein [Streptomyces sp.]
MAAVRAPVRRRARPRRPDTLGRMTTTVVSVLDRMRHTGAALPYEDGV